MRRAGIVLVAAMIVIGPFGPVAAQATTRSTFDASARASILFSIVDVQPAFDPALADSRASTSGSGATSLQSVAWPSFLVDAFFFLYGFQSVERLGLGIAEARWPEGPGEAKATHSDLLFLNAGDPDDIPGRGGDAVARASSAGASGEVRLSETHLPGGDVTGASSQTSVVETGTAVIARASQRVTGLIAGPLSIGSLEGSASASAGEGGPVADASIVLGEASVAGIPVRLTAGELRAVSAGAQDAVNAALGQAGITVLVVPASQATTDEVVTASSGGLLVEFGAEAEDPTGTPRNAKFAFLFGSAAASARAVSLSEEAPAQPGDEHIIPGRPDIRVIVTPPQPGVPASRVDAPPVRILRRTVVTTPAAGVTGGARGAYGALILLAFGAILSRPLIRAAARA